MIIKFQKILLRKIKDISEEKLKYEFLFGSLFQIFHSRSDQLVAHLFEIGRIFKPNCLDDYFTISPTVLYAL